MKEYIELFKYFLKNYKQIFNGVYTSIIFKLLSKDKQSIILKRRNICNTCTFMSVNYTKLGVYTSNRRDKHCGVCKCNINLKTACLSCNCGIDEFNKNNITPLKLKWEKYK